MYWSPTSSLLRPFFRRRPLGYHLRLTRGPAGNRTTTGSLSAVQEAAIPTEPRGQFTLPAIQLADGHGYASISQFIVLCKMELNAFNDLREPIGVGRKKV